MTDAPMSPAMSSQTAGQPAGPVTGEDPGRTLGIVGLVLAIIANWIGLVVSIVAFRKSKSAGFNNGIAKAGIIVGCITTALVLVGGIVGAVAGVHMASTCADLGPGIHQVGGTTYTCS